MREFIFTWNIQNISHSWHKIMDAIKSPLFVAETLENTVWHLSFYPKGYDFSEWLSLSLHKSNDEGPKDFSFNCELSCVSANNLILASYVLERLKAADARKVGVTQLKFLRTHEVFVQRKDLYLHQDSLTLRCRIWRNLDIINRFGQSFGCTRLEIERIQSVENISPRTNDKAILIHSNKQNKLLMSFDISIEKDVLQVETKPVNTGQIKFAVFKFSVMVKNREPCEFSSSWTDKPFKQLWNTKMEGTNGNSLKIMYEFSYSTGEITNTTEMISPSSFKYPEFTMNCILSCIPSGKLCDCPSICKDLWDMYLNRIFCDVELKTETSSFWAHEVVLCARSPVFMAMFTNDMSEKSKKCVKIEDLGDDTLEKLLKFLYTDTFEETEWDTVLDLYYLADKYQVTLLKAFCGVYLMENISTLKVCELLMLADRHNDSDLKWHIEYYIIKHYYDIFDLPQWKQFAEKQPLWAARIMIRSQKLTIERRNPVSYRNAIDDFTSLYQQGTFKDIVIQTTTATFSVQKIMICAGSSKLMEILTSAQSSDCLKVEDLDNDTVSRLLLFLHTDSLKNINVEAAINLYKAAFTYQIERLKIKCSCFLVANINASNANNLLQLAFEHQDVKLQLLVEDFISLWDLKINVSNSLPKRTKINPPKRIETSRSKRLRLTKET